MTSAQFIPRLVRHLRDWRDFTLKSTFEAFQASITTALQVVADDLSLEETARVDADTQLNSALAAGLAGKAPTAHTHAALSNGSGASAGSVTIGADGTVTAGQPASNQMVELGRAGGGGDYAGIKHRDAPGFMLLQNAAGVAAFDSQTRFDFRVNSVTTLAADANRRVSVNNGFSHDAALHVTNGLATDPALVLQGAAGQSAPLLRLQLPSSTGTVRDAASIDAVSTDPTDATFTSAIVLSTAHNGGAPTERARINNFGVLIGDVQLSNPLHDLVISTPLGGNASFRLLPYLDDIYFDNTSPTGDIYFRINAETKLQIKKAGYLFVPNALQPPSGNPTGGGYLYSEGGALKWRGPSGTITQLAPA